MKTAAPIRAAAYHFFLTGFDFDGLFSTTVVSGRFFASLTGINWPLLASRPISSLLSFLDMSRLRLDYDIIQENGYFLLHQHLLLALAQVHSELLLDESLCCSTCLTV